MRGKIWSSEGKRRPVVIGDMNARIIGREVENVVDGFRVSGINENGGKII